MGTSLAGQKENGTFICRQRIHDEIRSCQSHSERASSPRRPVADRPSSDCSRRRKACSPSAREQRRTIERWFLGRREEIVHPHPELAVRVGFYLTLQSLQMSLLLGEQPSDLSAEEIVTEAKRMLTAYLMSGGALRGVS